MELFKEYIEPGEPGWEDTPASVENENGNNKAIKDAVDALEETIASFGNITDLSYEVVDEFNE